MKIGPLSNPLIQFEVERLLLKNFLAHFDTSKREDKICDAKFYQHKEFILNEKLN